jgi:hypothetical protein
MSGRNYLAEVKKVVGDYLEKHNPLVFSEAAADLIAQDNNGLIDGWLQARKLSLLTEYVSDENRSRRARKPRDEARATFQQFSDEFQDALESDGVEAARERTGWFFGKLWVTDGEGKRVQQELHTLNARQVTEARDGYRQRAAANKFYAAKLEAVRKKVARAGPEATVGSVYTKEEIDKMFERESS